MYICRNIIKMDVIAHNITQKFNRFYRQAIVKEQYPMLTSLSRKELRRTDALGVVFMLHHITNKDKTRIPTNEDLKVSPVFLDKIICQYKRQNVDFISLNTLSDIIHGKKQADRPFVAFTIDDGYLDNYTNALPVFEKYQVPFAIFVATDFIDKKAILWWDTIEELILRGEDIRTSDGHIYPCYTFQQRWNTFRVLREQILKLDQSLLQEELNKLFANYHLNWLAPIQENAMSWEQVSQISHHPLCTIGAHTVSHPALNKVSDKQFDFEISECLSKLKGAIGQNIKHFAYPYGTNNEIGSREQQLISKYDFDSIFFANGGCIKYEHLGHAEALPRVYLHEN